MRRRIVESNRSNSSNASRVNRLRETGGLLARRDTSRTELFDADDVEEGSSEAVEDRYDQLFLQVYWDCFINFDNVRYLKDS